MTHPLHRDDVHPRTDYTNGCRCAAATNARRIHQNRYYAGYRILRSGIGAQRRLQALAYMGWSLSELPKYTKLSRNGLKRIRMGANTEGIYLATLKEVERLYDQLHNVEGPSSRARTDAKKFGWAGPHQWMEIDDPNELPDTGKQKPLSVKEVAAEFDWLVRNGMSPEYAAEELGYPIQTVLDYRRRVKRSA